MKVQNLKAAAIFLAASFSFLGLTSCDNDDDDNQGGVQNPYAGAVYAMTNAETTNSIVSYGRNADGTLTFISTTNSGGQGTGPTNVPSGPGGNTFDPLASNYAVVMSEDNEFVFAVDAGSDEVSSFSVNDDYSLTHVSTVSAGGTAPVGLATVNNMVYVLNSNTGMGSLNGFTFDATTGALSAISGSDRALTGRATAIRFAKNESQLVVAEVNTNRIHVFGVNGNTLSSAPTTYQYPTPTDPQRNVQNPFGLETVVQGGNQVVIIAEARVFDQSGTAGPQTSSVGTFTLASDGTLTPVSSDVRIDTDGDDTTGPTAACWVVANENGTEAFTTNTFGNSLSTFDITSSGEANLSQSAAFQETGAFEEDGLTDAAVVGNYVYQMAAASGTIVSLAIQGNGALTEIDRDVNLPTTGGSQGVAGF
jgi:hypothetical protein